MTLTKLKTNIVSALLFSAVFTGFAHAQVQRNIGKYNLQMNLGLKGYDPVAVFPEGGGQAQKGVPETSLEYEGVTYMFANVQNMKLFMADPLKYEPTYGGWCAYAMAFGSQVDIQPDVFTIQGRRAHYFVSTRAKRNFDQDVASFEMRADDNWKKISGEEPRE